MADRRFLAVLALLLSLCLSQFMMLNHKHDAAADTQESTCEFCFHAHKSHDGLVRASNLSLLGHGVDTPNLSVFIANIPQFLHRILARAPPRNRSQKY